VRVAHARVGRELGARKQREPRLPQLEEGDAGRRRQRREAEDVAVERGGPLEVGDA
jgi:hypothetical protein